MILLTKTLNSYVPPVPLVSTWNIASNGETLTLPLTSASGATFNFDVDWGDGNQDTITSASASHVYATSGVKTVTITGTMEGWHFGGGGDRLKLLTMSGGDGMVFKYLCTNTYNGTDAPGGAGAFEGCSNLTTFNCPNWDVSQIDSLHYMFDGCGNLTTIDVSNWDVSNVINFGNTFSRLYSLTTEIDLSNWDMSTAEYLNGMFFYDYQLTSINSISGWTTTNFKYIQYMFGYCFALESVSINNWSTSNVIRMNNMFDEANALTTLDITSWDTGNVQYFDYMFYNTYELTTIDLSNLDTSSAIDMSVMFYCYSTGVNNLTSIGDISGWVTTNLTDVDSMFENCNSLTSLMPASVFWDNLGGGTTITSFALCFRNATNISNYASIPAGWK